MNGTARINGHPRRGSALLLVTIAMASSIVLAGAYVASRADGTVVGANLASSSDARNRVESALAVTTELLLNDEDWRTKHVDGVIIDEQSIEHGIRVRLTDLATGDAPSIDTVDVQAEIIGRAGVIERVADATFFVPLPAQNISVDLDLGEFAIFAGSNIEINSEAVVAPWEASPASHRGDPIRLATMLGNLDQWKCGSGRRGRIQFASRFDGKRITSCSPPPRSGRGTESRSPEGAFRWHVHKRDTTANLRTHPDERRGDG